MTILRMALLALLAMLGALAVPAHAVDYPPPPSGPILDEADLLPPDREAALDARLRTLNAQTGRAFVIVTVNSLQDEPIETYAVKLFEAWGIGGKETDQGLLLLVAPNERKVRIEVGYGLHGYVTDGLSGRIIRRVITPLFKQGDMAGGIEAGANALLEQLARTPEDAKAVAEAADQAAAAAQRQQSRISFGDVLKALAIVFVVLFFIIFSAVRAAARGGKRYRRGGGGVSPIVVWAASEILSEALRGGRGHGGGGFGGFGGGDGGGFGGGGGGFGGFGGGGSGGGGASGGW